VLHRGNKEKDNILAKAWGRPVKHVFQKFEESSMTKIVLDFFEQLFVNVAGRIVEPEHGSALKLKDSTGGVAPSLAKAKSVIDENASEQCLTMAFEVIFKEIERYIAILMKYKGADWGTFARFRNKERKEKEDASTFTEIENEENKLLDEISEEEGEDDDNEDSGEKKEGDDDDKKSQKSSKSQEKEPEAEVEKPAEEQKEEAKEDNSSSSGSDSDGNSEGGENGEAEKEEEVEKEKNELSQILIKKREADVKELSRLYNHGFLKRLLRLVELFSSIATASSHPLSMVQRVANPYSLSSLLNLLMVVAPENKVLILKVIQNLI
jgi:hypothetical protein